jgi:hypothetical protein
VSIEIFIRDIEVADAVRWPEGRIGKLGEVDVSDGIHYLRTEVGEVRAE